MPISLWMVSQCILSFSFYVWNGVNLNLRPCKHCDICLFLWVKESWKKIANLAKRFLIYCYYYCINDCFRLAALKKALPPRYENSNFFLLHLFSHVSSLREYMGVYSLCPIRAILKENYYRSDKHVECGIPVILLIRRHRIDYTRTRTKRRIICIHKAIVDN